MNTNTTTATTTRPHAWQIDIKKTEPSTPTYPRPERAYPRVIGENAHEALWRVAEDIRGTWYGGETVAELLSENWTNTFNLYRNGLAYIRILTHERGHTLDIFEARYTALND